MNQKTIFITVSVVLILVGLIFVFKQALGPDFNQAELSFDDPTAIGSNGFNSEAGVVKSEELFFQQIQQLQNITFAESKILDDPSFERLNDNTVTLSSVPAGRLNPFLPIDLRQSLEQLKKDDSSNNQDVAESDPINESSDDDFEEVPDELMEDLETDEDSFEVRLPGE